MMKVLIPLPSFGFDPTEVAIPWMLLTENKFDCTFITPNGEKAVTDPLMLTGEKLGLLKPVLQARQDAIDAFNKMLETDAFSNPLAYGDVSEEEFDGLLLPGGHDKGVKEYLESKTLQQLVVKFFKKEKPVAAICHGTVLLAKSIDEETEKSVIHQYQTTSLLKSQELLAYQLTRLWLGDYYLTYPELTVEDEVKSVLADESQYLRGPNPVLRDNKENLQRGFVVKDRNYISARWPGDAYSFTFGFIDMLNFNTGK